MCLASATRPGKLLRQQPRAARFQQARERRARPAVWLGERPPVLLVVARPAGRREVPEHHYADPIAPVLGRPAVGADDVVGLLLLADPVPGVGRVHLIGGPAKFEQPDLLAAVVVAHHHLAELLDAAKLKLAWPP